MNDYENSKMTPWEVSGRVAMTYELPNNFLIRNVKIEKLRGISIGSSPIYIYSLDSVCLISPQ